MTAAQRNLARLALACAVAVGLGLAALFWWYRFEDPQGEATADCEKVELQPRYSPDRKWVASGHNTICDVFGGNSAVYLHVHGANESESSENLVFRYFEHGGEDPPGIQWTDDRSVVISVARVSKITKSVNKYREVNLTYRIGGQDYSKGS